MNPGSTAEPDLDEQTRFADEEAIYARLATLSPAQYAKERKELPEQLTIPAGWLDKEWKDRTRAAKRGGASTPQEREMFRTDNPWDYPGQRGRAAY